MDLVGSKAVCESSSMSLMAGVMACLTTLAIIRLSVLLTDMGRVLAVLWESSFGKKKRLE